MKLSTVFVTTLWLTPVQSANNPSPRIQVPNLSTQKSSNPPKCDGDFNDGVYLGADVAKSLWSGNCADIWTFEEDVDAYLNKYYPTDTSNWRVNSCHEGMANGAYQVVVQQENKCLNETPDECYDLGQGAAQQIAYDFCPFSATSYGHSEDEPDYKASCRSVAYGVCEGAIYQYVRDNGCKDITTSELNDLQDECKGQVDSMTGGGEKTIVVPECKKNGKNYKRCAEPVAAKDEAPCDDIEYYVCGKGMKDSDKQYCKCIGLYGSAQFLRGESE